MDSIGAFEARNDFADLLDRIARGEKIIITRRGVPAAILVPVGSTTSKLSHREIVQGLRSLRKRVKADSMNVPK